MFNENYKYSIHYLTFSNSFVQIFTAHRAETKKSIKTFTFIWDFKKRLKENILNIIYSKISIISRNNENLQCRLTKYYLYFMNYFISNHRHQSNISMCWYPSILKKNEFALKNLRRKGRLLEESMRYKNINY